MDRLLEGENSNGRVGNYSNHSANGSIVISGDHFLNSEPINPTTEQRPLALLGTGRDRHR
jgi:hypothetical protein